MRTIENAFLKLYCVLLDFYSYFDKRSQESLSPFQQSERHQKRPIQFTMPNFAEQTSADEIFPAEDFEENKDQVCS